jgi:dUTP pyrophosphatase
MCNCNKPINVNVKLLNEKAKSPYYSTLGSSGADLYYTGDQVIIRPGQIRHLHTGIALEIISDGNYDIQVRSRSGLSSKGLVLMNGVGTIDQDYRGELIMVVKNISSVACNIESGDRIGQLVLVPLLKMDFNVCENLSDTTRGNGGFGSTGK